MSCSLLEEFQSLKSAKQKLNFWKDRFNVYYLDYLKSPNREEHMTLHNFRIGEEEGKERKELNEWILENTPIHFPRQVFLTLSRLKKELNKDLSTTTLKKKILLDKKREIDEPFSRPQGKWALPFHPKYYADKKAFKYSYEDNDEPDYSRVYPNFVVHSHNGYVLGQFRRYIDSEINNVDSRKEDSLNIEQLALLLDTVGALDGMDCDISDKARIFHPLLRVNEKDLYDALRNVRGDIAKDQENKRALQKFLDQQNVKSRAKMLEKLDDKRTKKVSSKK